MMSTLKRVGRGAVTFFTNPKVKSTLDLLAATFLVLKAINELRSSSKNPEAEEQDDE
jgi:hypothetical protein